MYIKDKLETIDTPNIYYRDDIKCYLDPIRKKLIKVTPEETVRQIIIQFIKKYMKVKEKFIQVEIQLKDYGIKTLKRADIIIEQLIDNVYYPLIVVECKSKNVELTDNVLEQVIGYADDINSPFVIITNGEFMEILEYDEITNKYYYLEDIPTYEDLIINNTNRNYDKKEDFIRTTIDQLNDIKCIENKDKELRRYMIGDDTDDKIKPFIVNLGECLLDKSRKFPKGYYNGINIVEDIGLRYVTYGNSGGGCFTGIYRTIMIEDKNKNIQMFSFSMLSYEKNKEEGRKGDSVLIVAIDNFEKSHNSLQLRIDNKLKFIGSDFVKIIHNGRITVGNKGSAKVDGLKKLISMDCPEIMIDNEIVLGTLKSNQLYYIDSEDVMMLITNLIKYSLIREKYRKIIKSR